MEIITKPVMHGDCNIICGDTEHLLIDCGSDNRGNNVNSSSFAYGKINKEISRNDITDIMVSHFHKDHFNGILKIPDSYKIKTAYLPYSIIKNEIPYVKGIGRLLAIASPYSRGFQLSRDIIELFRKLVCISNEIHFLKKDDVLFFDNDEIRILWPDICHIVHFMHNPVKLPDEQGVITSINNTEWFTSIKAEEHFFTIEDRLSTEFSEMVKSFQIENQGLLPTMHKFIDYLNNFIYSRHETSEVSFERTYEAYKDLINQRNRFRRRLNVNDSSRINYFALQQYHNIVTCMNAISIVFDCKNRFLFLGDAPSRVVDYLSPLFYDNYKFVKIQHHGTKSYYTSNTPVGNYNLISSGGYISRKIHRNYVDRVSRERVICTSAHKSSSDFCNYATNKMCSQSCTKVFDQHLLTV